ncbi:rho GTPase-activating protein 20 isoform X2 [Oryzias latipes]|uniref:rho GTPase-activating protein 20 isoform X2 n=1 Tax=Oryzias latipes TaxID=8090 RepID=UPI0009D95E02|nr:rho GTPase-activating protein 20 isoform X2 [Oryzias latipes]
MNPVSLRLADLFPAPEQTRFQSYRRQSAPSMVISKALTRSKTLSRESFLVPVCPETCPLVQSLLAGSDRSFLLHGQAQLKTGMQTQDRHLFLFTDILVIAKAKSANHFKQKLQVCVCEMWTAGCMDEVCEGSTHPDRGFVMGWPTWNCAAMFSSAELKEKWLSVLRSRIKEEKEKEEPKTIPLRVYGKGINTFAFTKTLPVSNSDSTNEVIRLALQQFGTIGNVKDFQLWVISKRDNTPYPLIGHEFPFSIHMSHVRRLEAQGGGRNGDPQAEQLQGYHQCQFVLKPRPVEPPPQHADFTQKPFKRRRSLIAWAFWRGSSSHLNELSLAPRGRLFGRPLNSVCAEGELPKPVMDMLVFLYHEGSWTRGIFRRSAGARATRELRDALDTGEAELPLTRDHVFIIAGVFKDFLRSIPGSLFGCELYEEWLEVLEEEEDEGERVQDIQRMIHRMAKENALLLRYLLAMLHAVQSHAHENQMTSFNLSVCIAPSLLWPPGDPCSCELEGEGTKKVCQLVKFMIERCQQILGEEPSSLFGGPPQRHSEDDSGPESWVYPLTDSSYDSLENELEEGSPGTPSFCRRGVRPKPLRGSLDSILTFSEEEVDLDVRLSRSDRLRCLKLRPGERRRRAELPRPREVGSPEGVSSTLDSLSLEGRHNQRRRSEPAIAYNPRLRPHISGSTEGLTGDEGEELSSSQAPRRGRRGNSEVNGRSARLEASSSSLSSTPASPSLDSLDSLGGDPTGSTRTQQPPALPNPGVSSKEAVPKEPLSWGGLKGCIGLHPNSWLKKDRRLSLTQQDGLEVEAEERPGHKQNPGGSTGGAKLNASSQAKHKAPCRGPAERQRPNQKPECSSPPALQLPKPSWLQPSESSAGVLISDASGSRRDGAPSAKLPSPSLFYKQSGPTLSLFRRHKTQSVEEPSNRLYQRRGSEPGRQVVERTFTRARLPSDPGLKVTEVDSQGGPSEPRFCLSPGATKAVRDYFSGHPRSNPKSSQQVALALVDSRREWVKRCSDPSVEPDLEQLLFAEESYV